MARWSSRILLGLAVASIAGAAMAGTVTYTYDAQGRVKTVTYSDGTVITYTYDAAGNRTAYVVS